MSTGFACPPEADSLHPWLQPVAPLGRVVAWSDRSLKRKRGSVGNVTNDEVRVSAACGRTVPEDVGNDKAREHGTRHTPNTPSPDGTAEGAPLGATAVAGVNAFDQPSRWDLRFVRVTQTPC